MPVLPAAWSRDPPGSSVRLPKECAIRPVTVFSPAAGLLVGAVACGLGGARRSGPTEAPGGS